MARRVSAKAGMEAMLDQPPASAGARTKSWVFISSLDDLAKFDGACMQLLVCQPERHPHIGHRYQGYVELNERQRNTWVIAALGYKVVKGHGNGLNASGHCNRIGVRPRTGDQKEAVRCVVSSKSCRACHAGDAVAWPELAKDCADGCKRAVGKYKVGQAVVYGRPMNLECFSEERDKDILGMVKAGKSRVDVCASIMGMCACSTRGLTTSLRCIVRIAMLYPHATRPRPAGCMATVAA